LSGGISGLLSWVSEEGYSVTSEQSIMICHEWTQARVLAARGPGSCYFNPPPHPTEMWDTGHFLMRLALLMNLNSGKHTRPWLEGVGWGGGNNE
jgi:hypothetical protein